MKIKRTAILFLCVTICTACAKKTEIKYEMSGETVNDGSLKGLWTDFIENMPDDRNAEEDFRESEFMSELKGFLADEKSMELSADELKELTGIEDIMLLEAENDGRYARIVYLGADLYNSSVYEVTVRNKYVFMQYMDTCGYAFKTIYDGDFFYPMDFKLIDGRAIILSSYGAYYPSPAAIGVWRTENGKIDDADAFEEYSADGWVFTKGGQTIRIVKEYPDGLNYGEIDKTICSLDDDGSAELSAGDDRLTLKFDGYKYILKE